MVKRRIPYPNLLTTKVSQTLTLCFHPTFAHFLPPSYILAHVSLSSPKAVQSLMTRVVLFVIPGSYVKHSPNSSVQSTEANHI